MIYLFFAISLIFIGTQIFLYFQSPVTAAINLISLIFMFYLTKDVHKELEKSREDEAAHNDD